MPKLIVGLGNPGPQYQFTRHNIGFLILDQLAQKWGVSFDRNKFKAQFCEYFPPQGEKVILIKPQTYMNLSGESVQPWVQFLKIEMEDLLVIHDELDLPLLRFKAQSGSRSAGHRGVASIIQMLGHADFARLRVGIGRPEMAKRVVDFVLSLFSKPELELLPQIFEKSLHAIEIFLEKGLDPMKNIVNRKE